MLCASVPVTANWTPALNPSRTVAIRVGAMVCLIPVAVRDWINCASEWFWVVALMTILTSCLVLGSGIGLLCS